ncbi:MAG: ATP-dependent helicase/nuclease subunit [Clostridiales bacterium]|nr:ATP-dependent helicase/nuclease subunit [Clostridiales bacterium]
MRILYFEPYSCKRRHALVVECIERIKQGQTALYILPSREAMFDVRRLFAEQMGGIFNCHVFGFDDLERMILENELRKKRVIDDTEQRVILRQLVEGLSEDNFFRRVRYKQGFLNLMIDTIRLFKRSCVTPDEFWVRTSSFHGRLLEKCRGVYEIYQQYERFKARRNLMDIEDISIEAIKACKDARILKATGVIVIDGFVNVDPVNLNLVSSIMESHPDIPIYVNVPFKNDYNREFVMEEIVKDFEGLGFERVEAGVDAGSNLEELARRLYSGGASVRIDGESLQILNSPCIDHEIRTAARRIKGLIQDSNVNPSDIAVVVADMDGYRDKVLEVFREYGIPIKARRQNGLVSIPLIKDIISLLKFVLYQEERDSAFVSIVTSKYLLPFDVLHHEGFEVARLLAIAERILGEYSGQPGMYFAEFLKGYAETAQDDAARAGMEEYIGVVTEFLSRLESLVNAQNSSPVELFQLFNELLKRLNIEDKISKLYSHGLLDVELWLRDIEAVSRMLDALERLYKAYGQYASEGGIATLQQAVHDVISALSEQQPADLSAERGGVRLIIPDLIRGQRYHAVFVLGLNESIFPVGGSGVGIFDGCEADRLFEVGINLRPLWWELEREKIRFNACISSARKSLYLSYRTADEGGSVMIPSPFIDEVLSTLDEQTRRAVVAQHVSMRDRMAFDEKPCSAREAIKAFSLHMRNAQGGRRIDWKVPADEAANRLRYSAYAADIEFSREFCPQFDSYDGRLTLPRLKQQDLEYAFSASQLNSYVWCPFTYFAQRVLDIQAEDDAAERSMGIGSFYHSVLKAYYQDNDDVLTPDMQRFNAIFFEQAQDLHLDHVLPPLKDFALKQLHSVLENFIIHDARSMARYYEVTGRILKPVMLEEFFETTIDGCSAVIRGVADRVDMEADAKGRFTGRYIIYDYKKSGIKSIKECIEGTDFQLPLYHAAVDEMIKRRFGVKNPECLALLYYSIEKLEWNGIIRKDIKNALFEGKKGPRTTPAKGNMQVVLSWSLKEAAKVIDRIRQGYFMPQKECPAGIFGCAYSGMCRHDQARMARKERV